MRVTRDEIKEFNLLIQKEKDMLDRIMCSHEDIYNVYYNDNTVIIQFKAGRNIPGDYLEGLDDVIEYDSYEIGIGTVVEEFLKFKYSEDILQITIRL